MDRAIPTFGTSQGVTTAGSGTNPPTPEILTSQVVGMTGINPAPTAARR
jgi:hypothetical protein